MGADRFDPFVHLDGVAHPVDFNILSPEEAAAGFAELQAARIIRAE